MLVILLNFTKFKLQAYKKIEFINAQYYAIKQHIIMFTHF